MAKRTLDVPPHVTPHITSILDEAKSRIEQKLAQKRAAATHQEEDIISWAERRFYINATNLPIVLMPHQKAWLKLALTRDTTGHFPYQTLVYSTIKQSGKTSIAGMILRWYAENGVRNSELYAIGNDKDQAKTRAFREARHSISLTPGYDSGRERLPGEWTIMKETMTYAKTGTEIRALAVDAKGEAGGKPAIQVWCVTGETEVLCRTGWKQAQDLTTEDECATLDPKTEIMTWQRPRAVNVTPYKGRMVKFSHRRASFVVTPNHRVLGKYIWQSEDAEREHERGWRFEEADKARKFMGGWLKGDAKWEGEEHFDELTARLLGYFISEGTGYKDRIVICQSEKNADVLENMKATVNALGLEHSLYRQGDVVTISIRSKELAAYCARFGKSRDKFIPRNLLDAQPEALRSFFDAYIEGDGSWKTWQGQRTDSATATTISKRLADDLFEIGLKLGYHPRVSTYESDRKYQEKNGYTSTVYRLSFSKGPIYWAGKRHWEDIEYDGVVACPSLPNGTLYIRHEGKACWTGNTEVWGVTDEAQRRFWDELTPIPTIPDSVRVVETYAGYLGESELLYDLYTTGTEDGHQLTAQELTDRTGEPLDAFVETTGNPDAKIPIWENKAASLLMYWDSGLEARRMPWQLNDRGTLYYLNQEATLLPNPFRRLHFNEWVSPEGQFIQEEQWDACYDPSLKDQLEPGSKVPLVIALDAASTADCFAVVAVSRNPNEDKHDEVVVRFVKVWDPKKIPGGVINYDEIERFVAFICNGGHYDTSTGSVLLHPKVDPEDIYDPECERCRKQDFDVPGYNVQQVCYDPYQLEHFIQRLRKKRIVWCDKFLQQQDRLMADRSLYDMIINRRIGHNGDPLLKQHVLNAGAKYQTDQDSTLRLVKTAQAKKIDAVVALSMAASRCLYLNL